MDRVPSDENLHESSRQPLPRRPVDDLERAYLRRRPKSMGGADPRRYAWIPEDEEPCRMVKGMEKKIVWVKPGRQKNRKGEGR